MSSSRCRDKAEWVACPRDSLDFLRESCYGIDTELVVPPRAISQELDRSSHQRIYMPKKNQNVILHGSGQWAVKRDGAQRASGVYQSQAAAIRAARKAAKREKVELVVRDHRGKIRFRDSYGHDPFPPKG